VLSDEVTINRFLTNAVNVGAHASRVANREELDEAIQRAVGDAELIYCPSVTEAEKDLRLPSNRRTDDYTVANVCVEEVLGAIAETGSLISSSHREKPVQASLLPSHHVALVSSDNIYATLDDFFDSFSESLPTNITLITGPSRTADIELTLTIGVHGPEQLTIIVL
jgi:L-lactate dehydrogenase complex protein LldG